MPPAPRGVRISYGPSLAPVDSGIRLIQFSVADREAVKSCVTAHPEIGRLPESAFRAPQHLPIPVHWTESGLSFHWAGDGRLRRSTFRDAGFTAPIPLATQSGQCWWALGGLAGATDRKSVV